MSLINCDTCGQPVSEKAVKCPHCGKYVHKESVYIKPIGFYKKWFIILIGISLLWGLYAFDVCESHLIF